MINCAIIGCGNIAGGYDNPDDDKIRTHAKAFQRHSRCHLVGVCDSDLDKANYFAKLWDASFATVDPVELLDRCKPDLLSICTPTNTHEEFFQLACRKHIAHVWLEKPAAGSLGAVERMLELANATENQVWVNYFRRYDPGFIAIKARLPELGKIQHVRALYTKGLRHNGSHLIDLLLWYFGEITKIKVNEILDDTEFPSVSARLQTETADVDLVALDYKAYEMFELDILGESGRVRVIDGGQKIISERVVESKYYNGYRNLAVYEVHTGTYTTFMKNGLSRGLKGKLMPGLLEEIAIQKVLDSIRVNP
ncbi:MAG: Gfo/Idh/MocA family oxidoreductase [Desulfobulbaceae bacterium]|nr:Gfo/Idh/MocA family oxidoreductase [Desulfobulbaceae bacterium]